MVRKVLERRLLSGEKMNLNAHESTAEPTSHDMSTVLHAIVFGILGMNGGFCT